MKPAPPVSRTLTRVASVSGRQGHLEAASTLDVVHGDLPPCDSTTPRAMARPSPAPPSSPLRDGVPRQPVSNTRAGWPPECRRSRRSRRPGCDRPRPAGPQSHDQLPVGVPDRVGDQIGHRPGQIVGRTEHRQPVVFRDIDFQPYPLRPSRRRRLGCDIGDQLGQRHQVCGLASGRPARGRARTGRPPDRSSGPRWRAGAPSPVERRRSRRPPGPRRAPANRPAACAGHGT